MNYEYNPETGVLEITVFNGETLETATEKIMTNVPLDKIEPYVAERIVEIEKEIKEFHKLFPKDFMKKSR